MDDEEDALLDMLPTAARWLVMSVPPGAPTGLAPATLHGSGRQANGSVTLTLRRDSVDSVLAGPFTPTSSSHLTADLRALPATDFYLHVQGNQRRQSPSGSMLH